MRRRPRWPTYVEESNGRIVYRPKINGEPPIGYGIDGRGRMKPPVKLGKTGDSDDSILRAYLKVKEVLVDPEQFVKNTLFWVRDRYLQSLKFRKLSVSSQRWYEIHVGVLLDCDMVVSKKKCKLGNLQPSQLSLPMINAIKDRMYQKSIDKGESGVAYVNGHIRACRAMLSWALNNIEGLGILQNPLKGVNLDTENQRTRYVNDEDYMTQYLFAVDHSPEYLPLVFEHAYLLACRSVEVCNLNLEDVLSEGYIVRRTKNSKNNIITWTPRLEAARDAAMMFRGRFVGKLLGKNDPLIPSMWGNRLTKNTLQSAMQEIKKLMHEAGIGGICWNLHDLKRKGISDAKDARIGGHKSDHIRERYMVKLKSFEAPA